MAVSSLEDSNTFEYIMGSQNVGKPFQAAANSWDSQHQTVDTHFHAIYALLQWHSVHASIDFKLWPSLDKLMFAKHWC